MGSHAITYAVVALAIAGICLVAGFAWGRSNVKSQVEEAVEKEQVALDAREFAMRTQLEDAVAEVVKLRPLAEELGRVQKRLEREQAKYAQMKADFNATVGISAEPSAQQSSDSELQPAQIESADEAIQKLLHSLDVLNDPNAPDDVEPLLREPEPALPAPAPPVPAMATPVSVAKSAGIAQPPRPAVVPRPAEAARAIASARPLVPARSSEPISAVPPLASPVAPAAALPSRPATPQPQKVAPPQPRMPVPNMPGRPSGTEPGKPGQKVDEWQEFARQLEALTGKKK
jgi:hypothetical protein